MLRGADGTRHVVSNGEIRISSNQTRIFSRSVLVLPLPYDVDVDHALALATAAGADLRSDPVFGPDILGDIPHNYVTEPQHRIEIYRKLAQAGEKPALESLQKELRDRFGPLPSAVELLLQVAELKILASEKSVTNIEVKEDKLMLTRQGDFITLGGKFPRLTKKDAKARLKEIKKLLPAI